MDYLYEDTTVYIILFVVFILKLDCKSKIYFDIKDENTNFYGIVQIMTLYYFHLFNTTI